MADRTPHRVRAFLREELPRWRAEGIVDERGAEAISARYLAGPDGTGVAVAAIYVLAACMLGAGVISLVAWHWDELPRAARLAILGVALVSAHLAGWHLWKVQARRPRLGHAISLLGTIVFGASIGLVAQIFHVSGAWYGAFGAWALGALAAGVILPGLPELALAMILGLFVWAPGYAADHATRGDAVAWAAGLVALALAFRARSRVLFLLSAAGLATVLTTATLAAGHDNTPEFLAPILSVAAASCAFAAFAPQRAPHRYAASAAWLGRLAFLGFAYWPSFESLARESLVHGAPVTSGTRAFATCVLPPLLAAVALLLIPRADAPGGWPRRAVAWVATAFGVFYALATLTRIPSVPIAITANVALLGVAGVQIADGLRSRRRAAFWEGLAVAAIVAVSRFFEIESLLWLKGLGFIVCGIAVLAAALAFERRLAAAAAEVDHA